MGASIALKKKQLSLSLFHYSLFNLMGLPFTNQHKPFMRVLQKI